MEFEYVKINNELLEKIAVDFDSDWITKFNCFDSDTYGLAAMSGDIPVGYIFVTSRKLTYPLEHITDAYIDIIEVMDEYQRQGIGQALVIHSEEWAREMGFKQIRTHSNDKAANAIKMWHKLNYGLCPHDYYAEEGCIGYWVAKVL